MQPSRAINQVQESRPRSSTQASIVKNSGMMVRNSSQSKVKAAGNNLNYSDAQQKEVHEG